MLRNEATTIYSPGYAPLADLSIAARQKGEKKIQSNPLFTACGREGGRAKQDRVSQLAK